MKIVKIIATALKKEMIMIIIPNVVLLLEKLPPKTFTIFIKSIPMNLQLIEL